MVNEFTLLINEIIKYGISSNYRSGKHLRELKKKLIELLLFYEKNDFFVDDTEYPEFDRSEYFYVKDNLKLNFPSLNNYKIFSNSININDLQDVQVKNVVEDLNEIFLDLLEVKHNLEQNGLYAGTNAFEFLYEMRMEEKILNVISYITRLKYVA